jgi:hypothetical protein
MNNNKNKKKSEITAKENSKSRRIRRRRRRRRRRIDSYSSPTSLSSSIFWEQKSIGERVERPQIGSSSRRNSEKSLSRIHHSAVFPWTSMPFVIVAEILRVKWMNKNSTYTKMAEKERNKDNKEERLPSYSSKSGHVGTKITEVK